MADTKSASHAPFLLEIVTPDRKVFSGRILSVTCEGTEGRFQVLHLHAPLLSALGTGVTKVVHEAGNTEIFAMSGGFAQVFHDRVLLLVESAESRTTIDVDRAQRARERAELRLRQRDEEIDVDRAHAALMRAMNRLKVADLH